MEEKSSPPAGRTATSNIQRRQDHSLKELLWIPAIPTGRFPADTLSPVTDHPISNNDPAPMAVEVQMEIWESFLQTENCKSR